ncbi:hypothetical protein D320_04275 [Haloferax sp. BAB-2207]|nr:hypothetical protein D320_04275 [Haloferax sp. BAB-2207]
MSHPDEHAFGVRGVDDAVEVLPERAVADVETDLRRLHRDAAIEVRRAQLADEVDVRVGVGVGGRPVGVVLAEQVQYPRDAVAVQRLDVRDRSVGRLARHEVVRDGGYHDPLL